jgi:antitoxin YefM
MLSSLSACKPSSAEAPKFDCFFVDIPVHALYILTRIIVNQEGAQTMKTLSLSEAKMKLSELVDRVHSTDEEVMITKNGRPAAVLVSPGEFDSWKETIEILSSPDLMEEIKRGLSALRRGSKVYTLEELID